MGAVTDQIKKNSNNITEENLFIIFRQILESVNYLHHNNIFGCCLYLSYFIFDKLTLTIKFTDLGFSKVFLSDKNICDNELQNGYKFNEYTPPEVFAKMGSSYNLTEIDKLKNEKFDVWQLGILFFKIASFGQSPYDDVTNENLKDYIINKNINYSKLDKYNSQIVQIIDKMLQTSPANRYNISQLLNLIQFKDNKIPLLNIQMSKKEEISITSNMVNDEKKKIGNDFK